jgi:hypothetical protein
MAGAAAALRKLDGVPPMLMIAGYRSSDEGALKAGCPDSRIVAIPACGHICHSGTTGSVQCGAEV